MSPPSIGNPPAEAPHGSPHEAPYGSPPGEASGQSPRQSQQSQPSPEGPSSAQALRQISVPRVLAVANQKGGVGKTTTTINLATAMAACGRNVLIVDMDPQGNASTGLGIDRKSRNITAYDVLIEETPIERAALPTAVPGLSIVPASVDLTGAELELIQISGRESRLRRALRLTDLPWDLVLIDCPPALGFLTLNALVAADAVLVPLQCEFYALEGLSHLLKTIERIKRGYNPSLDIQGIVLTMYDKRNSICGMVEEDVRRHLGDKVYRTIIPRNVRVSEAPSHGKPVLVYDWRCAGSQAYIHLAGEVLKREANLIASDAA
ncbi:MAG: ParA family protein [Alphaproteobacteria bacterium]